MTRNDIVVERTMILSIQGDTSIGFRRKSESLTRRQVTGRKGRTDLRSQERLYELDPKGRRFGILSEALRIVVLRGLEKS